MRKEAFLLGLLVTLFILSGAGPAQGFDYVICHGTSDCADYGEPSNPQPAKGETYTDPDMNTHVTRISDADNDGHNGIYFKPVYSEPCVSNFDDTYLLLHRPGGVGAKTYFIYTGPENANPYVLVRQLDEVNYADSSPHWDGSNPDVLYYVRNYGEQTTGGDGPKFYRYEVSTDTATALHDFSNPATTPQDIVDILTEPGTQRYIFLGEYGDPSADRRYWAFGIFGRGGEGLLAAVTYDRVTDTVLGYLTSPDDIYVGIDKGRIAFSPSGQYANIKSSTFCERLWDKTLTRWDYERCANKHGDWGMDVYGNDVIFTGWGTWRDSWGMFDPSDGTMYGMVDTPCCGAGDHVSGNAVDKPGWAVISIYGENGEWDENNIFAVEMDKDKADWKLPYGGSYQDLNPAESARIWRLVNSQNIYSSYQEQPHATISRTGRYIYWGSNWRGTDSTETYQIALPETWYEDLMGPLETCSSLGYRCCDACEAGTEQTQYDGDCPGQVCCGSCYTMTESSHYGIKISAYDFSDSYIPFIADKIDLLNTDKVKSTQVQQIKNLNPSITAIFYDNALTHSQWSAPEDWFIHDAITGDRLVNKDWGWQLMDITNPAYKTDLANAIKGSLDSNPVFDGVMLDDTWDSMSSDRFYREGTTTEGLVPQSYIGSFHNDMIALLAEIKVTIGNKMLLPNTGYYVTDYLAVADGQMYEAFCHANWQTIDEWYGDWQVKLDAMISASGSGKIWAAQSGILDGATEVDINRTQRYCYAMYLLGAGDNTYFHFKPSMTYQGVTYFPEWDIDIGDPTEDYHVMSGTSLYGREFENGLALINPSATTIQVSLDGYYQTIDGDTVNTLTLGSHEGEVLTKVVSTQTCSQLDGSCCSSGDSCSGNPQFTTDCPGFCCAGGECYTIGITRIPRTASTITLDGSISEFLSLTPFRFSDTVQDNTADVYVTWDDTSLYLAFDVEDAQLNADVTSGKDNGGWNDDAVELYIDTQNNGGSSMQTDDYQFYVNIYNAKGDLRGTGSGKTGTWDSSFQSAVSVSGTINSNTDTDAGYSIEMVIPWPDIGGTPANGTVMAIDLVVDDQDSSSTTFFDWAGIYPDSFSNPDRWTEVLFAVSGHRADTSGDGCIDIGELTSFIELWFTGSQGVTMPELMQGVTLWRAGTGCT